MNDPEFTCPHGRDAEELLAYVEGRLDEEGRRDLEEHLDSCGPCAEEVASLRRMDGLLRQYPDSFHPREDELYRFVHSGEDTGGLIASHLQWCTDCSEDVEILREMLTQGRAAPEGSHRAPESLLQSLDRRFGREKKPGSLDLLLGFFRGLLKHPFRLPTLALGTGAAVIIIAMVTVPYLRTGKMAPALEKLAPLEDRGATEMEGVPAVREEESVAGEIAAKQYPAKAAPVLKGRGPKDALPVYAPKPTGTLKRDAKDEIPASRDKFKALKRVRQPDALSQTQEPLKSRKKPARRLSAPRAPEPAVPGKTKRPAIVVGSSEARRDLETSPPREESTQAVTVRIVDAQGRPIPWLRLEPPKDLDGAGFRVQDAEEAKKETLVERQSAVPKMRFRAAEDRDTRSKHILIRVDKKNERYDLKAQLFEPSSRRARKTIKAFGVPREDVEKRIRVIVSELLTEK